MVPSTAGVTLPMGLMVDTRPDLPEACDKRDLPRFGGNTDAGLSLVVEADEHLCDAAAHLGRK